MRWLVEIPLSRRELVSRLRSRPALWGLLGLAALTSVFPLAQVAGPAQRVGASALSAGLNAALFTVQLLGVLVIVPAMTAGAIAGERERGTYDLLHATRVGATSIVVAKLAAPLTVVLIVLVATAPLVSLSVLTGGIGLVAILRAYGVIAWTAVVVATICLEASMRSATTTVAVGRGLGRSAVLLAGVTAVGILIGAPTSSPVLYATPFTALLAALAPPDWPGTIPGLSAIQSYLLWGLAIVGWHLASLLWRVRRPDIREPRWLAVARLPLFGRARATSPRSWSSALLLRLSDRDEEWIGNPVLLNEVRTGLVGSPIWRNTLFWSGFTLAAVLGGVVRPYDDAVLWTGGVTLGAIALVSPAIAAGLIARERATGTWDLLAGSLLEGREIWRGKMLAGVYAVCGLALGSALGILLGHVLRDVHLERLYRGAWASGTFVLVAGTTGWLSVTVSLLCSAAAGSVTRAYVLAYASLFGLWVVLPAIGGLLSCGLLAVPWNPVVAWTVAAGSGIDSAQRAMIASLSLVSHLVLATAAIFALDRIGRQRLDDPRLPRERKEHTVVPRSGIEW